MKRLGFTLIEIMLALMVASIGMVSLIGLLSSSINTSSKAHDDITVVTFADLVLNYLHAEDFSAVPSSGPLLLPDPYGTEVELEQGPSATYTGELEALGGNTPQKYTVSYTLSIKPQNSVKTVTLKIWPGLNTSSKPRIFYTELYNWSKS